METLGPEPAQNNSGGDAAHVDQNQVEPLLHQLAVSDFRSGGTQSRGEGRSDQLIVSVGDP